MTLKSFAQMEEFVLNRRGKKRVALAAAHDAVALEALLTAVDKNVAEAVLIGKADKICELLVQMGKVPAEFEIIDEQDDRAMVDRAVAMVRSGQADLPMKGLMHTSTFMKGILDKETGLLKPGELLSQASVFEDPRQGGLFIVSDCAVNIQPGVEEKVRITENCLKLANTLGIAEPRVALVSALEVVNPKITNTVEADEVKKRMAGRCLIDGPLALDNAIDMEAAAHKGIHSPVAGRANILIMPDLWSGNIFSKGLVFYARMKGAGTLNGLNSPVVMSSRTDTAENKYLSVLTAVLQSIR